MKKIQPLLPISLKNDGNLEIIFLGVGSAFAMKNYQTNFLIIKGDHHILVDFGEDGKRALPNITGLKVEDIECVLPTHSHPDHVNGIATIGLANRYIGQRFMGKPKAKMIITEDYQRILWDQTLRGGLEYNENIPDGLDFSNLSLEQIKEVYDKTVGVRHLNFTDFFDVIRPKWKTHQPREIFEVDYGNIHIELFRTNHMPEQSDSWQAAFVSFGLLIDGRVFVSGDTKFDPELIDFYSDRSEIMFHDVQFYPGAVHAPLEDLKTLSADVKSKMFLMHYADSWESQDIEGFGGWAGQGVSYRF